MNKNIYREGVTIERMKSITSEKEECVLKSEDDNEVYLAWNDMEWEILGDVEEYNVSAAELCREYDGVTNVFIPGIDM